ncbi:MAG: neutral zinc metallopeptidase [Solirubrobacterales bacterium]
MRSLTRTACMLAAVGTVAGASGCVELDETPTYASEESKSRLAGFTKDLGDELNAFWGEQWGEGWKPARIKVPKRAADTACGTIDADETGPAYCGDDRTMVLPAAFFRDEIIDADNSGRNDAAVAAVVGHEFGHHLQTLSGIEEVVDQAAEENPEVANLISVAYELNADCLMGIWMSSVDDEKRLEPGDLEEVLGALDKIGDDNLSVDAGVEVDPSEFNHGTSAQRIYWFAEGFDTQDIDACSKVFDDLLDGTLEEETFSTSSD